MNRSVIALAALAAAALAVAGASAAPVARGGNGCPTTALLPLDADAIGPSVSAAFSADPAKNRPQVVGAMLAAQDTDRGPQVKRDCGTRVWQRTVVVYITDRAFLPSASISERVLFVGRTPAGYRVWQRAH